MEFPSNDEWRVATNNNERLKVTASSVTATNKFEGKGTIQYVDVSHLSATDDDDTVNYSIPSGHSVVVMLFALLQVWLKSYKKY